MLLLLTSAISPPFPFPQFFTRCGMIPQIFYCLSADLHHPILCISSRRLSLTKTPSFPCASGFRYSRTIVPASSKSVCPGDSLMLKARSNSSSFSVTNDSASLAAADAPTGTARQIQKTIQSHHGQQARSPDCSEPSEPRVSGGCPGSGLGIRHNVYLDLPGVALSGGGPGPFLQ